MQKDANDHQWFHALVREQRGWKDDLPSLGELGLGSWAISAGVAARQPLDRSGLVDRPPTTELESMGEEVFQEETTFVGEKMAVVVSVKNKGKMLTQLTRC